MLLTAPPEVYYALAPRVGGIKRCDDAPLTSVGRLSPMVKVVFWSRGAHLTKPGWSKPHTHSNSTNLALFRHKITLYRFNQGAHTIAGGLKREQAGGGGGGGPPTPPPPPRKYATVYPNLFKRLNIASILSKAQQTWILPKLEGHTQCAIQWASTQHLYAYLAAYPDVATALGYTFVGSTLILRNVHVSPSLGYHEIIQQEKKTLKSTPSDSVQRRKLIALRRVF